MKTKILLSRPDWFKTNLTAGCELEPNRGHLRAGCSDDDAVERTGLRQAELAVSVFQTH